MDLGGRFARPTSALGHVGVRLMARANRDLATWTASLRHLGAEGAVPAIGFGPGVGIVELPGAPRMVGWAASIHRPWVLQQARRRIS